LIPASSVVYVSPRSEILFERRQHIVGYHGRAAHQGTRTEWVIVSVHSVLRLRVAILAHDNFFQRTVPDLTNTSQQS